MIEKFEVKKSVESDHLPMTLTREKGTRSENDCRDNDPKEYANWPKKEIERYRNDLKTVKREEIKDMKDLNKEIKKAISWRKSTLTPNKPNWFDK